MKIHDISHKIVLFCELTIKTTKSRPPPTGDGLQQQTATRTRTSNGADPPSNLQRKDKETVRQRPRVSRANDTLEVIRALLAYDSPENHATERQSQLLKKGTLGIHRRDDGNTYRGKGIGIGQCWLPENLGWLRSGLNHGRCSLSGCIYFEQANFGKR